MEQSELFSDPILLGSIAGVVGNIPKAILTLIFQQFGWMYYTFISWRTFYEKGSTY